MKKIFAILLSLAISASGMVAMAQSKTAKDADKAIITEERLAEREKAVAQRMNKRMDIENEQDISLFANGSEVTLSGTISLPLNAKALEETYVHIEAIPVGERFVNTTYNVLGTGIEKYFIMNKGKSSVSYSLDVPEGDYIIAVYGYGAAENTTLGTTYYYSENGLVTNLSMAKRVEMTADKTLNMAFEAVENSISGTITFAEPVAESGYAYFSVNTYVASHDEYLYSDVEIYVEKGTKKIDYTIPALKGSTTVSFSLPNDDLEYFSIIDELSDWDLMRYFNTEVKSYTNIDYIYDNSAKATVDTVTVNITLPEETEDYLWLNAIMLPTNGPTQHSGVSIPKGSTTASIVFNAPESDYILQVTDHRSIDYYYRAAPGATTNFDNADIISKDEKTVNFNFPQCYKLTGTVTRNGLYEGNSVTSELEVLIGDERFYTEVEFAAKSDTAEYSIDIPKYLEGSEAEVFVYPIYGATVSDTVTVDNSMTVDLAYPENLTMLVSGTITLTEPAPEGGVGVSIGYGERNYFYIPEGESSLDYIAEIANDGSFVDTIEVNFEFYSDDMSFCGYAYEEFDIADTENCDITFTPIEYVKVSGSVKIPDGVILTSGVTCYIYANIEYDHIGLDCSIGKDETEVAYSFYAKKGDIIYDLVCSVQASGTSPVTGYDLRCEYNGNTEWSEIEVSDDIANADFTLEKSAMIAAKLVLPENIEITNETRLIIDVYDEEYNEVGSFSSEISARETPINILIPEELTGNVAIEYHITGNDQIVVDKYFVGADGPSTEEVWFDIEEIAKSTIEIKPVMNRSVINISATKNGITNSIVSIGIKLLFDNNAQELYGFDIYEDDTAGECTVKIPSNDTYADTSSFKVAYRVLIDNETEIDWVYLTENGGITWNADKAYSFQLEEKINISLIELDRASTLDDAVVEDLLNVNCYEAVVTDSGVDVSLTYTNDTATPFFVITAILAGYDANGVLQDIETSDIGLRAQINQETYSIPATIDETLTYKVLFWNNVEDMFPILSAVTVD